MGAYHKVEVSLNTNAVEVGIPSPQTVNVVVPTIGPSGPQGPAGAVTSVNGQTGAVTVTVPTASSATPQPSGTAATGSASAFARGDHRHAHYTVIEQEVTGTQGSPAQISVTAAQQPAMVLLTYEGTNEFALVTLSQPTSSADATVIIRATGVGEVPRLRVVDGRQIDNVVIYPASGYDEIAFDRDYVFRWNGNRWDMDFASDNDTVAREIFRPAHTGTLAAFLNQIPSTPTSTGTTGQLAWGYAEGAQRLYICVATNTWRRITIASW